MSDPMLPLLIEPEELPAKRELALFRLVDLSSAEQYAAAHIPGAVHLVPARTTSGPPVPGLLPPLEQLEQILGELGHHADLHYIVYDDEGGGWAGRFIWLLDCVGHQRYSYINGGLKAWMQAGFLTEQTPNTVKPTTPELRIEHDPSISLDELRAGLDDPDLVIWDARSPAEYRGEKAFSRKGGHIPGAVNFEWTAGMDAQRGLRLRCDLAGQLEALGITPDKQIVTHCQTHHRSGFTYLAAKILGYPRVRAYPGSWAEWGNHPDTPVES
ncbi:rhodanese-like domain-containing protein [Halopseudomonas sp.]|uniref:rhodanese-like domain-containing protein n=1 Tax=Halopseudomonas sp. TaxID=2901191 RepID=UPI003569F68E